MSHCLDYGRALVVSGETPGSALACASAPFSLAAGLCWGQSRPCVAQC